MRFDRAAHRARNRVERTISRLADLIKDDRAIATRYDTLNESIHSQLADEVGHLA